jgi:phage shock protein A
MLRARAYDFDNRDAGQMYEYLEARIEALKKRISELEQENATLMTFWSEAEAVKEQEPKGAERFTTFFS